MTSTATDRAALVTDVAIKTPCLVATTANITLSGAKTIDGVAVVAGNRVLVKNQNTASQNGIYIASATAWARATDFDGVRDIAEGTLVYITDGTAYTQTMWAITTSNPVIDSTSIAFSQLAAISTGTYLPLSGGILTGGVTGTTLTLSGLFSGAAATLTGTLTGVAGNFSGALAGISLNVTGSSAPAAGCYLQSANTLTISSRSLPVMQFNNQATAVNYFIAQGTAAGTYPAFGVSTDSGDTDAGINFFTKGAGDYFFLTTAGTAPQFKIKHTASAVNYIQVTGSASGGGAANIAAVGTDSNIDIVFTPQGTGKPKFGSSDCFSANGTVATAVTSLGPVGSHTTVQKWLTVKDSSSTVLYIPAF